MVVLRIFRNLSANLNRSPIYSACHGPPPVSTSASTQLSTISAAAPTYFNVFTVEEFETNGKKGNSWTKIGAAFPHKEGLGFSIELKAFPIDGRLVVLPPDNDDNRNNK
jgi:hypothetical protein